MGPAPGEDFGTLLNRYRERRGMSLAELAQALQDLGYPREDVHQGALLLAIMNHQGHRWRNRPAIINGIAEVLELTSEKSSALMRAYLYRPPDQPHRRQRR